jgi:hypothetical protein
MMITMIKDITDITAIVCTFLSSIKTSFFWNFCLCYVFVLFYESMMKEKDTNLFFQGCIIVIIWQEEQSGWDNWKMFMIGENKKQMCDLF